MGLAERRLAHLRLVHRRKARLAKSHVLLKVSAKRRLHHLGRGSQRGLRVRRGAAHGLPEEQLLGGHLEAVGAAVGERRRVRVEVWRVRVLRRVPLHLIEVAARIFINLWVRGPSGFK